MPQNKKKKCQISRLEQNINTASPVQLPCISYAQLSSLVSYRFSSIRMVWIAIKELMSIQFWEEENETILTLVQIKFPSQF